MIVMLNLVKYICQVVIHKDVLYVEDNTSSVNVMDMTLTLQDGLAFGQAKLKQLILV